MKCPYRKKVEKKTLGNRTFVNNHFMECYGAECPFYVPESSTDCENIKECERCKHRFCDPGACNQCIDQGGGNFFCKLHGVQVVKDWHNTEYERICKQGRRPQDTAKPVKGKPNGKRRDCRGR